MNQLLTLKDSDIFPDYKSFLKDENYIFRSASRVVVRDGAGRIALLHVRKQQFYKLPGGGVEEGESVIAAVIRECVEELGSKVEIESELGSILEYRDRFGLKQESFCYVGKLVGRPGVPQFDEGELALDFNPLWASMEEGLRLLQESTPEDYAGKFIVRRDLEFLRTYNNYRSQAIH